MGMFLALVASFVRAEDGYLEHIAQGLACAEQGQWAPAQAHFLAAEALDPEDPLGYLGQGLAALAQGRIQEATALFRRGTVLEGARAVASCGLGLCYLQTGYWEDAATYFTQALEQEPGLAIARAGLALIDFQQERFDSAQDHLRAIPTPGPADLLRDYVRGLLAYQQGEWEVLFQLWPALNARLTEASRGPGLFLPVRLAFADHSRLRLEVDRWLRPTDEMAPLRVPPPPPPPPPDRPHLTQPAPGDTVSGTVAVQFKIPPGLRFHYVTLLVDGQIVAMTNQSPYRCRWDSTRWPDGPHTLTVRTRGEEEGESSLEVRVDNGGRATARYDEAEYRAMANRLARFCTLIPPPTEVESLPLHAYLWSGEMEKAVALCEEAFLRDPTRRETQERLLELYAQTGRSRSVDDLPELRRGLPGGQRVALTFDDGPNDPPTRELLQWLDRYQARATFLVVGRRVDEYPHLLREIVAHGHEIANHTYSHRNLCTLDRPTLWVELLQVERAVERAGGHCRRFVRPPGGRYNRRVRAALAAFGYIPVFWTLNGGDYQNFSPEEAGARMAAEAQDGDIFLLHNGPDNTLDLLPHLLRHLQARGLRCVPLSEILREPGELGGTMGN